MCEYCNKDEFNEELIYQSVGLGILGGISNQVGIVRREEGWLMVSSVNARQLYEEERIKINYCPICGRKLEKED